MIELRNLEKSYGDLRVLDKLDFSFQSGHVYGIVGENGAGKTTLFRCMTGLERYSGEILYSKGKLKDELGFLPTNPFFMSNITGKEYLQLLCNARKIPYFKIEDKNVFDLPLDHYTNTYSTGMKKKLALLGILLQKNKLYILDEPYNGVDIHSNLLITEIILRLKSLGKTVIISSHIFSTLTDTCDSLHLLKKGNFLQNVFKNEFSLIEDEMRGTEINNKIDSLDL